MDLLPQLGTQPRTLLRRTVAHGPAALSVLVPALLAAAHGPSVPFAADDGGVLRVLAFAPPGPWHGLDALVAAPFTWLPLGTLALRAALVGACLAGLAGAMLFELSRRLLQTVAPNVRGLSWLALVGATTALLGWAWQTESTAVGGNVLGAVLALAAVCVSSSAQPIAPAFMPGNLGLAALFVTLAFGQDPWAGAGAAVACILQFALRRREERPPPPWARTLIWAAAGLVPVVVSTALWMGGGAKDGMLLHGLRGAGPGGLGRFFAEAGLLVPGLAVAGAAIALRKTDTRPLAAALVALVFAGAAAASFGAPSGPSRYDAAVLASLGALGVLAVAGAGALVRVVARARLPFAETSGAMVVLLAVAVPVQAADDATVRLANRPVAASALFALAAFDALPEGAVLIVQDARILAHVAASLARGSFRTDLTVLSTDHLTGREASQLLSREPLLASFLRDVLLKGAPEEFALSSLSAARPVVLMVDGHMDRTLARHLSPAGLFDAFERDPVGQSDRRAAESASQPAMDKLLRAVRSPLEEDVRVMTESALRARLAGDLVAGDREASLRTLFSLREAGGDDGRLLELEKRLGSTKSVGEPRDVALLGPTR